ncbi:MAG: hypothetical protein IMW98_04510, partial [Firmicutes bacterium]|nr:hypothetical protein [Bacillota bacterium]
LSALLAVILGQGLARWIWLRRSWGDEPAAEIDRGLGEPAPEDGRILTRRP